MWEFFWFLLGAITYKILAIWLDTGRKAKFINDIRFLAFNLIGQAFEQLISASVLKYEFLEQTEDKEKIKFHQNIDEQYLHEWKEEAVSILNSSVPPIYKNTLNAKDWKKLMVLLDSYYKEKIYQTTSKDEE